MLTAEAVDLVMKDCLFKEEEVTGVKPPEGAVVVEGIVSKYAFHPQRLEQNREKVKAMLDELPETFEGGWTFLNMCYDKHDNQWTGEHRVMEELMCLGLALGLMIYCLPDRKLWGVFHGSMPYVQVLP